MHLWLRDGGRCPFPFSLQHHIGRLLPLLLSWPQTLRAAPPLPCPLSWESHAGLAKGSLWITWIIAWVFFFLRLRDAIWTCRKRQAGFGVKNSEGEGGLSMR